MARPRTLSMTAVVIVCFVSMQWTATLFASPLASVPSPQTDRSLYAASANFFANPSHLERAQSHAFAGQVYQGRPYRMAHNGSIAALMVGAVATITGAALLVYANRPECDLRQYAGGCGYGSKVIGGAVLSGGIAGLFVGALTWK